MPKSKNNKLVLGITGGIGAGKSTVAAMFTRPGFIRIDADKLGHDLLKQPAIKKKLVKLFGAGILDSENSIVRSKLGRLAFSSPASWSKLNCLVMSGICANIKKKIRGAGKKSVILDASLLLEANLRKLVDKLVVVTAAKEQRILRSRRKLGLSRKEVIQRMKFQISQKEKLRFADFIIDNSQNLEKTRKQVSQIRRKLWKS